MVKFSKSCSEGFHRDTDRSVVFKFCEMRPTENRWNSALLTWQKTNTISPGSPAVATRRSRPKSARASPDNVLRVLQISFKSVHFRPSYSRTREHRQNAPWNESNIRLKPSFEPNNKICRSPLYKTSTSAALKSQMSTLKKYTLETFFYRATLF